MSDGVVTIVLPEDAQKAQHLLNRAQAGDQEALAKIKEAFKNESDVLIKISGGDLSKTLASKLTTAITGPTPNLLGFGIETKMAALRAELGGPNPTPLETLAVEAVCLAWLDLHVAGLQTAAENTIKYKDILDRRYERANRRYSQAIKTLAFVKRVSGPSVVNVQQNGAINKAVIKPS